MYVTSQKVFFLKMEMASGFQAPSEDSLDSLELSRLSQTGLAKKEKLHQTTSS